MKTFRQFIQTLGSKSMTNDDKEKASPPKSNIPPSLPEKPSQQPTSVLNESVKVPQKKK